MQRFLFTFLIFLIGGVYWITNVVLAEPQFGGKVEMYIENCNCSNNSYVKVGSPHGGDYIKNHSTKSYDCEPLAEGDWILGMHTEQTEQCKIRIGQYCVTIAEGKVIEYYGTSPNNCGSGPSDASKSVVDRIIQDRDSKGKSDAGFRGNDFDSLNTSGTDRSASIVRNIKNQRDQKENKQNNGNQRAFSGKSKGGMNTTNDGQGGLRSLGTQLLGGKIGDNLNNLQVLAGTVLLLIGLLLAGYFLYKASRALLNNFK